MRTGTQTTFIFLERGSEDMQLLKELNKITAATGISSIKEFIKTYPMIHELKYGLQQEREEG